MENILIWAKIKLKVNKIMSNFLCSPKILNLDISSEKTKFKKKSFKLLTLHWTSCLMIPLTFLHDANIDRSKLSEQKKTFEYIVPPPTSGVGTIIVILLWDVEL